MILTGSQNFTGDPVLDGTTEVILESALKRSRSVYPFAGVAMRGLVNELAPGAAGKDEEVGRLIAEKRQQRVTMAHAGVAPDGVGYRISLVAKDGATGAPLAELTERATDLSRFVPAVARLACALRRLLGDVTCDAASAERVGLSPKIDAVHEYTLAWSAFASAR